MQITVDADRLAANGVSLFQISSALRDNNVSLPAGAIFEGGQAVLAKTTHTFSSIDDLKGLVVGMSEAGPVLLGDVAGVSLGAAAPKSISRTNGKPSVGVSIVKEAEANTIDVTTAVREALDGLTGLPADVEIVIVSDQGPSIQHQIDTLLREAMFGFLFAVTVVFAFMLTLKPTVPRGLLNTLPPDGRHRPGDPAERLHGRTSDGVAGHVAELHDAGRAWRSPSGAWSTTRLWCWRTSIATSRRDERDGGPRWRPRRRSAPRFSPRR